MTITQAEYLITCLMMQANANHKLPVAVKFVANSLSDWPPAEGEPTAMTNGASHALTDVRFICPGGDVRFRIRLEPIIEEIEDL